MINTKTKVKCFIVDNFLFGEDNDLQEVTSFLDEGIVDSMGFLELIEFLKVEFSITVKDEELLLENLDSIDNIARFVKRKLEASVTSSPNTQFRNA